MEENFYPGRYVSAGSQENALIRAGKTRLGGLSINSTNAAACYVKLYDKATAPSSSDTPVQQFYVAATPGQKEPVLPSNGLIFRLGLGIRIVTEQADNGTTGVTAGAVIMSYGIA
jgi:hypothetical protein